MKEMRGYLIVVMVVLLSVASAGCMGSGSGNTGSQGPASDGGNGGSVPGGRNSGSGGTLWSSDNFPDYVFFTFNCRGSWKVPTSSPEYEEGTFTVTGNVPFRIPYYWDNPAGVAVYVQDQSSGYYPPLYVNSEYSTCRREPDGNDCKPCHFIYTGKIYATGSMLYNASGGPGRKWVAAFHTVLPKNPSSPSSLADTLSITQTEAGCPAAYAEEVESDPSYLMTENAQLYCFSNMIDPVMSNSIDTPFTFTEGSTIDVHTPVTDDSLVMTDYDPSVSFHLGHG
jgi:hypothetical protein